DGYSLDDKRNKLDGYGDLQDILERFRKRDPKKDKDRKQKWFFVSKTELKESDYDLSFSSYREEVYDIIAYEKPDEILKNLNEVETAIFQGLDELKRLMR